VLAKLALDDERARDLVADLLVAKLDDLVESADPYPYFCTAVRNAGRSWLRRPTAKVRPDSGVARVTQEDASASARLELERVVIRLRPQEAEIFAAIAVGEDRDALARSYGTTRANIDQIISRARKRLKDEGLG
jgi:DNA-directed RNA polymerase specialized sigma24 family protein